MVAQTIKSSITFEARTGAVIKAGARIRVDCGNFSQTSIIKVAVEAVAVATAVLSCRCACACVSRDLCWQLASLGIGK